MAEEKEKKPGFWSKFGSKSLEKAKDVSNYDVGAGMMRGAGMAMGAARGTVGLFRLVGRATFLFVIIAAILHLAYIASGVVTLFSAYFIGYTVLGIFAAVFFYSDPADPFPLKRIVKFVLLAWAAYLLPLLINQMDRLISMPRELAAMLMIVTPLLVLYAFMNPGDGITRFLAGAYWIGISLWLIIGVFLPMLSASASPYSNILLSPAEMGSAFTNAFSKTSATITDSSKAIVTSVKDTVNGTKKVTQEFYQGSADNSQGKPLGIQLVDGQALFRKFRLDNDDIVATATIRSLTVNDKVYTINNTCYLKIMNPKASLNGGNRFIMINGTVSPPSFDISYTGDQYDQRLIECTITRDDINAANTGLTNTVFGEVIFNTTFNFSTSGYMTYGFMQKELFSNLRVDNKDPAHEMGLPSSLQQAKYTPGPVMIGMPADTTPYPVDAKIGATNPAVRIPLPAFGITFANAFQGRGGIQDFSTTYLYVPTQLKFSEQGDSTKPLCTPRTSTLVRSDDPKNEYGADYQRYEFVNLTRSTDSPYVTIRCPMWATANGLLGSSGAGIYTLFVTTQYTYAIDTSVPVTILFNASTDTLGVGLVPNMQTGTTKNDCKTLSPLCVGASCYCSYRTKDVLGMCKYAKGDNGNLQYAAGVVNGSDQVNGLCDDTTPIVAACAGLINCVDSDCTCIYKVSGGAQKCTWKIDQWASTLKCDAYKPDSAGATS